MSDLVHAKRKVPHVDLDNGFTRIANELLEHIYSSDFTSSELRVLGALIRHSYGYNSHSCQWSVRIAMEKANLTRGRAESAWMSLVKNNVVRCYEEAKGNRPGSWGVNKDYTTWKMGGTQGPLCHPHDLTQLCHPHGLTQKILNLTQTARKPDTNTPPNLTQIPLKPDTDTPGKTVPEAVSGGSKDNKEKDKDNNNTPPSFTYSYLTTSKEDLSFEVRTKLFKICLKMVETLRPTEPVKETNKRKLGAFLSTTVTEGLSEDVFLKMLKESVRRAVEESARRRKQDPKRVSCAVGTALYLMAEQFAILLEEFKQNAPRKPSTTPERKYDRRWVVYPAGSFGMPGRPHIEQWESCWADELTDEDRERDRLASIAWRDRMNAICAAREAKADELRAKNEENRRSRMLK